MPFAVWAWTAHGDDEWLTVIFELEGEAGWYRDRLETDRRLIHPQRGEHRAAGAVVESYEPALSIGERRPRTAAPPPSQRA
jgi:hypothetical protein